MTILNGIQKLRNFHTIPWSTIFYFENQKLKSNSRIIPWQPDYLEQIVSDFAYESLADDALYELAELYNYQLDKKEEAKALYMQMILDYPGSIYVEESRKKYRELREIYPDKDVQPATPETIIPEIKPNEFE